MKDIKQKLEDRPEDKENIDITQLDGSPAPDAVSKVAMGGKPETDDKHIDVYNTEWIKRLKDGGGDSEDHEDDEELHESDLQDAYAKLFEGLAGIMRCK